MNNEESMESINIIVEKLCELKQVPTCNKITEEQLACVKHYVKII